MWTTKNLLIVAMCIALAPPTWGAADTLNSTELKALNGWLAKHPEYRLATDEDCECADDIKQMKVGYAGNWTPVPDYHPYVATGDFNSDGVEDFAVVVINRTKRERNFVLAIFNGPFLSPAASPVFVKSGLELKGEGLVFGPPRPKPYRLVLGRFEAEGLILVPTAHSYKFKGG